MTYMAKAQDSCPMVMIFTILVNPSLIIFTVCSVCLIFHKD